MCFEYLRGECESSRAKSNTSEPEFQFHHAHPGEQNPKLQATATT
jgi:hypothetical protein